jgi:EmrB/QacA subfamily drug resistance transporter
MIDQEASLTPQRRNAIRALLAVAVLVVVMDITILNVALEAIQRGLNATNAELQWSLNSYAITFAAFIFTAGVCGDRFGRKRTLIAGLVIFGIGSVFAAFSPSMGWLIGWRAVMGVGAAVVPTVTLAIIMNVFPPAERMKAIATWAAAAGVAFAAGPLVGGVLLEWFSWGSVFLINAPLVVVGVALIARLVPESRAPASAGFDPAGVMLSIAAVGLLVFGIVEGGRGSDWLAASALGPIAAGIVLTIVLIYVESLAAAPSLDVSLFRNVRFSAATGVIALAFFALMGAIYVTTFYFQGVRGLSALEAGLLMLPMGVGSAWMSTRCPKLVPAFGIRVVVGAGALAMAVAFAGYAFVDRGTSIVAIVVLQLVFGLGWGCIMAPATGALMSVVPPAKAGAGQAVAQTLRQIGAALGVAVIGSVLSIAYRSSLGSSADLIPQGLRDEAATSIGGTMQAIGSAGSGLGAEEQRSLASAAVDAYTSAMHSTILIAAAFALLAAVVAVRWLPARPTAPALADPTKDAVRGPGAPISPGAPAPAGGPVPVAVPVGAAAGKRDST